MITNKYAILNLPSEALEKIIAHKDSVANNIDNVRYLDKNKCIIKLKIGIDTLDLLGISTLYTHSEILEEIKIYEIKDI